MEGKIIAPPFLAFVVKLSQLNELTTCLNPWIITPSAASHDSFTAGDLHPAITTVVYAVLEPLSLRLIQYSAIRPWILLLALSPVHLWWSSLLLDTHHWYAVAQKNHSVTLETHKVDISSKQKLKKPPPLALSLLLPVFTSALVNVALLLYTQSLQAPSLRQEPFIRYLAPFAILIYLGCRFADYKICIRTGRGLSLGHLEIGIFLSAFLYQTLLFAFRAFIRTTFGLIPFIAFQMPDPVEAERSFGSEQYKWIKQLPKIDPGAMMVAQVAGIGLMLLSRCLTARSFRSR